MKHVWGVRQGLLLMDFDDENSESMKQLLQQCMIHPTFLRIEEVGTVVNYNLFTP